RADSPPLRELTCPNLISNAWKPPAEIFSLRPADTDVEGWRMQAHPGRAGASARKSEPIFGKVDAQIQRVTATFARLERRAAL
ncbi:hypothetical protein, partial [Sinorhizobium sojae]|uniref:hypothetical protein n=1 Tax=Sinorhizobium sojae TaxID=716925 RepID=UPI001AEC4625